MKSVSKNSKTPRFEVDFKTRLKQARTALLPLRGFQQYRVYELKKESVGFKKGPITISVGAGKGWTIWVDELDGLFDPPSEVKWLKPKQVTFLRLKGHRVEEI